MFNCYSKNFHYSYMGPNTARHQIGSTVDDIGMYAPHNTHTHESGLKL